MDWKEEVLRKIYFSLVVSFILGFLLYFMLTGFYDIITKKRIFLNISYILLIFAVVFVISSVVIEQRSINPSKAPYFLIGGFIIAIVITFLFVCTASGITLLMKNGLPERDKFIASVSVLTAISFAMLKAVERGLRSY